MRIPSARERDKCPRDDGDPEESGENKNIGKIIENVFCVITTSQKSVKWRNIKKSPSKNYQEELELVSQKNKIEANWKLHRRIAIIDKLREEGKSS